jgi:hypothetical protein
MAHQPSAESHILLPIASRPQNWAGHDSRSRANRSPREVTIRRSHGESWHTRGVVKSPSGPNCPALGSTPPVTASVPDSTLLARHLRVLHATHRVHALSQEWPPARGPNRLTGRLLRLRQVRTRLDAKQGCPLDGQEEGCGARYELSRGAAVGAGQGTTGHGSERAQYHRRGVRRTR